MNAITDTVHHRACTICDAMCGLEITVRAGSVTDLRGDRADPLSRGFICPKATALTDLQNDGDRLRRPLLRSDRGWREIGWEEAFELAASRLQAIRQQHGGNAIGIYRGNPCAHNWGVLTHSPQFFRHIGSQSNFSAASVDSLPHHLVCYWMYGHQFLQPIPDIDRTDYLLFLGYNPMVTNGSLMAMPDFRGRLKQLRQRGGRMVVIDPRRSETAAVADRHHFIRPGTDAYLLLALVHEVLRINDAAGTDGSAALAPRLKHLRQMRAAVSSFSAEWAAGHTGIDAAAIRQLAREFATAPTAACHGRMGVSTQQHGTICQWAIQILNLITGNLGREGGTLLTQPAVAPITPQDRYKGSFGRRRTRVSGYPEFSGEFPVAALAEEILTPGNGQLRAMVTVAGNPVLSTPNGRQLDRALAGVDFMLSVDFYLNETTRHAHLILPPTAPLEHDHFDLMLYRFTVRNGVRYNAAVLPPAPDALHEWEIFNGLTAAWARLQGETVELLPAPEQVLDKWLRGGQVLYPDLQLDLAALQAQPHGFDLGPLQADFTDRLCSDDGLIDCLPAAIAEALEALREPADAASPAGLLLIGRRHIRSNNSWMHNSHRLMKGPRRDHLLMHPADLRERGIDDGDTVVVRSRVGSVHTVVEATEELMPGTVSLPHGWGHDREGIALAVASQRPGASINDLTDERRIDPLAGTSVLNGVPVEVERVLAI